MKKHTAETLGIMDILRIFPTEEKAVKWLERATWGEHPICPHCGGIDNIRVYKSKKFAYWHKDCRNTFTVKTGTVMHSSKIPVQKWAILLYYILTARKGISSLQLSKELDVTQKTAWFMLNRIREACSTSQDYTLSNVVEIDETYLGGKEANKHGNKKVHAGRGTVGKQAVIGMRERGGRTHAKPIQSTDIATMHKEIGDAVEFGATVYTDEHRSYQHLHTAYQHGTVNHSAKEYVNGMAHTNSIESVWALLKRGYHGVYHNWSQKHCHRYVNEFTFRLNEGNCRIDTIDRMTSLAKGITGKRLKYADLIA